MSALLVAIHDVAPATLARVQRLRDALAGWGVAHVTLLAVPDYHGEGKLAACAETAAWLRARTDAGDEICLHGHFHEQRRRIRSRVDRVRARVWTAGEGECLAQSEVARERMLGDEKHALEDLVGRRVHGFVAPAWLEPRGFAASLCKSGFAWHEGGTWVERLGDGGRRWHAPVVGFATRTPMRRLTTLAWAPIARRIAASAARHGGAPARLALHPDDGGSPSVLRAAERCVRALVRDLGAGATYATALRISATRRDVHAAE